MIHLQKYNYASEIINYSKTYFETKPRDCVLYSKDHAEFKIHWEVLNQTEFTRKLLKNAKNQCWDEIEIICPCTKEELEKIVHFLYYGEIWCEDIYESVNVLANLNKIFGFPENLNPDNLISTMLDDNPSVPPLIDLTDFGLDNEIIKNLADEMNIYVDAKIPLENPPHENSKNNDITKNAGSDETFAPNRGEYFA